MSCVLHRPLMVGALVTCAALTPVAAQTVPDVDEITFDNGEIPIQLVTPDGLPTNGILSITAFPPDVHDGPFALNYRYDRTDPVSFLSIPGLLTDLDELRFWMKTQHDAIWMIFHVDRDGAQFNAFVNLAAGTWTEIALAPDDFSLDANSKVFKPEMEPERNGTSYIAVDVAHLLGVPGTTQAWFDTMRVARPDLQYVDGSAIYLDGRPHQISQPTLINGDLVVVNGSQLDVDTTRLVVRGTIMSDNPGSFIHVRNGTLRLDSRFRFDRQLIAVREGAMRLEDLLFIPGSNVGVSALYGGAFELHATSVVDGAITSVVGEQGRMALSDSDAPGEFVINSNTTFSAERMNHIVVWLAADAGVNAELDVPESTIDRWTLGPGWNRDFLMTDITQANIALLVAEDSRLHVRDGTLRAVGLSFSTFDAEINGYQNYSYYDQQAFDLPARSLTFDNVDVVAWNFYAQGDAHITVRDSLFGEILTFDEGSALVFDSVCDGSGGYLGARDDSRIGLVRSDALCEVVCEGNSRFGVRNGTVRGPVTAAESSRIGLDRCEILGPLYEIDDGRIFIR